MADINVIRAAIFDVADAGHICSAACGIKHPWYFDQNESDEQTEHRAKFVDAVEARIRDLQGPMFNLGVKLQNLCERHKIARLPFPTVDACMDCEAEARAKLGDVG